MPRHPTPKTSPKERQLRPPPPETRALYKSVQSGTVDAPAGEHGATALFLGSAAGALPVVRILVGAGADVDLAVLGAAQWKGGGPKERQLAQAAASGDTRAVLKSVQSGTALDAPAGEHGATALFLGSAAGALPVVRILVGAGADVDLSVLGADRELVAPVTVAAQGGFLDVVRFLARAGAHLSSACTTLAASCGHRPVVAFLVDFDAALLDAPAEYDGATPLMTAAVFGFLPIVRLLHRRGADCNIPTVTGATAVYSAAEQGRLDMIKYLHETGHADVNAVTVGGASPLYIAAFNGYLPSVTYLVSAGAHLDRVTVDGATAVFGASWRGHTEIAHSLVRAGAAVNLNTRSGVGPLFVAAQQGHLPLVVFLIGSGAVLDQARRPDGATAASAAAENGRIDILRALAGAGARLDLHTLRCAELRGQSEVCAYLSNKGIAKARHVRLDRAWGELVTRRAAVALRPVPRRAATAGGTRPSTLLRWASERPKGEPMRRLALLPGRPTGEFYWYGAEPTRRPPRPTTAPGTAARGRWECSEEGNRAW